MKKIIFVSPDYESLGVEYLISVCQKNNYEVDFIYYEINDLYVNIKNDKDFSAEVASKAFERGADYVAFSCVTDNYHNQLRCAEAIKKLMPDCVTLFGGIHCTLVPDVVINESAIDCIFIGEAEKSLIEFLDQAKTSSDNLPEKAVKGAIFKKKGETFGDCVEGELISLDDLPFPDKDLYVKESGDVMREYRIISSRGCPYYCSYCFNDYMLALRGSVCLRKRSVDNVIQELKQAVAKYNIKYVMFLDDSFTTLKKWVFEFCQKYKEEIHLPFACIANPHYLNQEMIESLKDAGCFNVQIGIQSISEDLCSEVLNRRSNNQQLANVLLNLKRVGIMAHVDHMFGLPTDRIELQEKAMHFYNQYRPDLIVINWLKYYPKAKIIEVAHKEGILSKEDIKVLNQGGSLTKGSFLMHGDVKGSENYLGLLFIVNYLFLMPKWFVSWLINKKVYKKIRINNYFFVIALPRFIRSIFDRNDYKARTHLLNFFRMRFKRKKRVA